VAKNPETRRTSLDLDSASERRLQSLVERLGRMTGPLPSHRGRRRPSRADLLRAVLVVLDENRAFAAEVRARVVVEALAPHAADEVAAVAVELRRGASWLGTPDAQESAGRIAEQLEALPLGDAERASEALRGLAERIAWLAAQAGGYQGLRPLLDLARRLRLVRDAIDPAQTQVCLYCNQDVRAGNQSRFERHNDQAGSICPGGIS
jgi:hypothetical protein